MSSTLKDALRSINLLPLYHVSVRRHGENGVEYVGGGYVEDVIRRFGQCEVVDSAVYENIFCIYVR